MSYADSKSRLEIYSRAEQIGKIWRLEIDTDDIDMTFYRQIRRRHWECESYRYIMRFTWARTEHCWRGS